MAEGHAAVAHQHRAPAGFVWNYIFSLDHKVIGKQYYFLALFSVFLGMILSWLIRIHLVWPRAHIWGLDKLSSVGAPGGVMTPEYYLSLLTLHGTLMVFFVLTTAPQSGFGNYFLPIQIGAEDMAFPRLNMLSFWTTFLALVVLISTFFITDGPPIAGWTSYPPLSAVGSASGPGEGQGQTLWVIAIALFCIGSLLGALNFIATTLELRTRGMKLMRLPLTCWSWFITAVLGLLSFAVLFGACVLLLLDRVGGTSFFIPGGLVISDKIMNHSGGSPLLWQHLFWFFGHPEVYIAILPGMGVTSHILSCFARKPIFGYKVMAYSLMAIGFLSFTVWGHHMFISGMSPYSAFTFSIFTMAIGVPSAIKTFNWLGTLWGGKIRYTTPMLFAMGFISLFVTGGLSGLFLAQPPLDVYLHATYFVIGHFHLVMGVAAIFGIFAGTYFWFPKMFGRMMNDTLGKVHFWTTFIGVYCIFMPMHFLGIAGNPRRYSEFIDNFLVPLVPVHEFMTIAALLTGAAQFIFLFNLFWSMFKGERAPANPWEATSLEWSIPSPPPFDNFAGKQPVVYQDPYEYGVPGAAKDYVMQDSPEVLAAASD
ncbi:MAG TPA: cbb3-type cytochrome c oxidase subunit I [Candidatus Sulfotelmatobacter sp.]|nr:cbb3-type cytochrome c oxidase subunit I [Candidatus Sulfotelmatobacter sp.]